MKLIPVSLPVKGSNFFYQLLHRVFQKWYRECSGLLQVLKEMGGMVFVLLSNLAVVDDKHIPIDSCNMPVGPAEDLKSSIDNFIGRHDVVVIAQYIMQIDASFVFSHTSVLR